MSHPPPPLVTEVRGGTKAFIRPLTELITYLDISTLADISLPFNYLLRLPSARVNRKFQNLRCIIKSSLFCPDVRGGYSPSLRHHRVIARDHSNVSLGGDTRGDRALSASAPCKGNQRQFAKCFIAGKCDVVSVKARVFFQPAPSHFRILSRYAKKTLPC